MIRDGRNLGATVTGREEMTKRSSVLARRREEERQERKERILEAAKIVFFRGGYLGATVRDIALEAELSTGLIYHYFAGRDAVYGKVCEEAFGVLLDVLPLNYDETTLRTIEQIDVLWLKRRSIVRAFEIEHTTAVYSGILRMADLLALQPNMDIKRDCSSSTACFPIRPWRGEALKW